MHPSGIALRDPCMSLTSGTFLKVALSSQDQFQADQEARPLHLPRLWTDLKGQESFISLDIFLPPRAVHHTHIKDGIRTSKQSALCPHPPRLMIGNTGPPGSWRRTLGSCGLPGSHHPSAGLHPLLRTPVGYFKKFMVVSNGIVANS
jgi:hypothetical protein